MKLSNVFDKTLNASLVTVASLEIGYFTYKGFIFLSEYLYIISVG